MQLSVASVVPGWSALVVHSCVVGWSTIMQYVPKNMEWNRFEEELHWHLHWRGGNWGVLRVRPSPPEWEGFGFRCLYVPTPTDLRSPTRLSSRQASLRETVAFIGRTFDDITVMRLPCSNERYLPCSAQACITVFPSSSRQHAESSVSSVWKDITS